MKLGATRGVGEVAVSFWKAAVKPEISLRFAPTTAVDIWAPKLRVDETQAMVVMEAMCCLPRVGVYLARELPRQAGSGSHGFRCGK